MAKTSAAQRKSQAATLRRSRSVMAAMVLWPDREKFDAHQASAPAARLTCLYPQTGGPMADINEELLPDEEPIPVLQQLLDNPFLLLFLGIAMPTVLYIIWGVMEIVSLPIAK
jgi:hypothetical protein